MSEFNPLIQRIREWNVSLTRARKIGVDLEGMSNVGDDKEWRPAFLVGEGLRVAFGLQPRANQRCVPGVAATECGAAPLRSFE